MNRSFLKLQTRIHRRVYQWTNGRLGSDFGAPTLLLTTRGRRSGKLRTNPLFYLQDGERYVVVASNAGSELHPAWWLNLLSDSSAEIQVKAKQMRVRARAADAGERAILWPQLITLFSGYQTYQNDTQRIIPVVILESEL